MIVSWGGKLHSKRFDEIPGWQFVAVKYPRCVEYHLLLRRESLQRGYDAPLVASRHCIKCMLPPRRCHQRCVSRVTVVVARDEAARSHLVPPRHQVAVQSVSRVERVNVEPIDAAVGKLDCRVSIDNAFIWVTLPSNGATARHAAFWLATLTVS